eukprot:TRINITY_DN60195_c0_g2_i1.p1 TRINITY_DN60195_c0_g2~~TRINITY_DN60195_c0_g2_i1.p1  ORF type:complete len:593 (-),score=45.64 TRINITY_DN60195_c0_g2_i1:70-1848(-)
MQFESRSSPGADTDSSFLGSTRTLGLSDCLRAENESDMRQLTSELPAPLLRGVPLHRVLAGYGRHWRTSAGNDREFMQSVPTEVIDDFISHDWNTPRMDKTIALCYLYNSPMALAGSTAVALATAAVKCFRLWVSEKAPELPGGPFGLVVTGTCCLIAPIVYFALLFHGQDFQAAFQRLVAPMSSHLVFLDKLCINQEDASMKRSGVLGLAAFLKRSKRIVILWSPRYFTRLWCTYELATWVRLSKNADNVVFWPVASPKLIIATTASLSVASMLEALFRFLAVNELAFGFETMIGFLLCSCLFVSIAVTFPLQEVRLQLQSLDEQLSKFSISDSVCFCCLNGHRHPETSEAMPCDRTLVYRTLESWHSRAGNGHSEDRPQHYIDAFDDGVRTLLRALLVSIAPSRSLQLGYIEAVHLGLPFLWSGLDKALISLHSGKQGYSWLLVWSSLVDAVTISGLVVPATFMLVCRAMARLPQLDSYAQRGWRRRLLLAAFVWSPVMTTVLCVLRTPGFLFWQTQQFQLQLLWSVILAGVTFCLWRSSGHRPADYRAKPVLAKQPGCLPVDAQAAVVGCRHLDTHDPTDTATLSEGSL